MGNSVRTVTRRTVSDSVELSGDGDSKQRVTASRSELECSTPLTKHGSRNAADQDQDEKIKKIEEELRCRVNKVEREVYSLKRKIREWEREEEERRRVRQKMIAEEDRLARMDYETKRRVHVEEEERDRLRMQRGSGGL